MAVPPPRPHVRRAPDAAMIHDKLALRAHLRAERDRFAAANMRAIVVPEAVAALFKPDMVVTTYCPMGSEADPSLLAAAAVDAGCRLALPHVVRRSMPMRFLAWDPARALEPGPFGLSQPPADSPELVPDLILTPLVGFDRRLNRLGQGAGYYDRAFARFDHAMRIGVAWSVQEVPAVPADIWDVPLHLIVTEKEVICHKES